jgi:hypothetical protein
MKKYEGVEVTQGNATGKAGVPSLPFNKGYYSSGGNSGAAGIEFTPSSEPFNKTYKNMKHSKKNVKEKREKMKKFKEYLSEDACATMGNTGGMGAVTSAQPSGTPGDVAGSTPGSGDIGSKGGTFMKSTLNLKKDKKKKLKNITAFKSFNP